MHRLVQFLSVHKLFVKNLHAEKSVYNRLIGSKIAQKRLFKKQNHSKNPTHRIVFFKCEYSEVRNNTNSLPRLINNNKKSRSTYFSLHLIDKKIVLELK